MQAKRQARRGLKERQKRKKMNNVMTKTGFFNWISQKAKSKKLAVSEKLTKALAEKVKKENKEKEDATKSNNNPSAKVDTKKDSPTS